MSVFDTNSLYSVWATSSGNNPYGSGLLSAPDSTRSSGTSFPVNLSVLPTSGANAPVLTSISQDRAFRGRSDRFTLYGRNLGPVTSILLNGNPDLTVSLYGRAEDQIEVSYELPPNATAGDRSISVSNGFQTSNALTWRIGDPTPVIEQIAPSVWTKGETTSVTIYGSGFGASPLLNAGSGITFSNVTATEDSQISAQVTVAPDAAPDERTVTVTSQGASGNGFQPVGGSQAGTGGTAQLRGQAGPVLELTVLESGGTSRVVQANEVIFITGSPPTMPALTARLINASATEQVRWRLEIVDNYYQRAVNVERHLMVQNVSCYPTEAICPAAYETQSATAPWAVSWGMAIRGGRATVYWTYQGLERQFTFRIAGRNPAKADLQRALGYQGPGLDFAPYWFSWGLMMSEGGTYQFCVTPYHVRNNCDEKLKDEPLYGRPSGYGLMQIDREVGQHTTPDERWDWTANVASGMEIIAAKKIVENRSLTFAEIAREAWNLSNPGRPPVELPNDEVASFVTTTGVRTDYPECTFSAGDEPIWWNNVGGRLPIGATEFRPWLDANTVMAYLGVARLLTFQENGPLARPVWKLTPFSNHEGNPNFSKIGQACREIKNGRN